MKKCFILFQIEIELCDEGQDMPDLSQGGSKTAASGVKYAYPAATATAHDESKSESTNTSNTESLEELMSKMKKL